MPLSDDFWADDPEPAKSECHGCIYDIGGNCTADLHVVRCPLDVEEPWVTAHTVSVPPSAPITIQDLAATFQAIEKAPLRAQNMFMTEGDFKEFQEWAQEARGNLQHGTS